MRLTRVGDNHGYACTVDGFGGGDFETAGAFHHDECDVVFFKVFDGMGDPFGVVGFGFSFRQRRNGDDEVSFGNVDACVIVLGTHHKPALHSVVLSGNCPVVSMGARPLPELRNGCLPRLGTGGGRAVCCYDTGVPIYKGVCGTHARGFCFSDDLYQIASPDGGARLLFAEVDSGCGIYQLVAQLDRNGRHIRLCYDDNGLLHSIYDGSGRHFQPVFSSIRLHDNDPDFDPAGERDVFVSEDERFYVNRLTSVTSNGKELVRYYEPEAGRFVNQDPIGLLGGKFVWICA